jgi:uncharacterized protein YbjT (DUF2867 family)
MNPDHHVLILGATGRTGSQTLTQLLQRHIAVRAIVRSADRLPAGVADDPLLEVVEADVLAMPLGDLVEALDGCDTVISCLGHTISARGLFGAPHLLVEGAIRRVHEALEVRPPAAPVRLVLMSIVSVNLPQHADTRRRRGERAYLGGLGVILPPVRDNQGAADFLAHEVGPTNPRLRWVAVRPDTLVKGDVAEYALHDTLIASIFKPDHTRMSQVAHFMCELVADDTTWQRWAGRMPVIVDTQPRA